MLLKIVSHAYSSSHSILTNPNLALYDLDYVTKQLKSILAMFPRSDGLVL